MPYEDREGGGAALRNRNAKDNPKAPSHKGTFLWNGVRLELALWEKQSEKAGTYYSFKISTAREKTNGGERDPWD